MNRVINHFTSIDQLLSTIGSAEQRAEAAQLAACPVSESMPVDLWLDRASLLTTVVNSQKRLTALLRRKGLVGETRVAITAARDQRREFAIWLRAHAKREVYVRLHPTATFDDEPTPEQEERG
jgi:hypothetical protein